MVGPHLQAGGLHGGGDAPEGLPGHEGRGALHGDHGLVREAALQEAVEAGGVELSQGVGVGIRKVDEGQVEGRSGGFLEPHHGVGVDHFYAGIVKGGAVELAHHGLLPGHVGHGRVQVHQHHLLHGWVFQHFAHGKAIPSAADQDALRVGPEAEGRMHQGLVVAVLVGARELQVAVEEELEAAPASGEHDALVGAVASVDDVVREDLFFDRQGELPGETQAHRQEDHDGQAAQPDHPGGSQLGLQQVGGPEAHGGVQQAEEQAGAHQAQLGHEQQREQQRGEEGADVVEGEHPCHQVLEAHLVLEDAHENGDLQPHQRAHGQHHGVEHDPEGVGVGEGLEEDGRREAAHQGHRQLQVHEAPCQAAMQELGQPRAQAHGAEVDTDHRGELGDRIPQQVARQRPRHQLVDQPATGDEQHADEQQRRPQRGLLRQVIHEWRRR